MTLGGEAAAVSMTGANGGTDAMVGLAVMRKIDSAVAADAALCIAGEAASRDFLTAKAETSPPQTKKMVIRRNLRIHMLSFLPHRLCKR